MALKIGFLFRETARSVCTRTGKEFGGQPIACGSRREADVAVHQGQRSGISRNSELEQARTAQIAAGRKQLSRSGLVHGAVLAVETGDATSLTGASFSLRP